MPIRDRFYQYPPLMDASRVPVVAPDKEGIHMSLLLRPAARHHHREIPQVSLAFR